MSWILLNKKIPTRPSPPRFSLFWSMPWPDGKYSERQKITCHVCGEVPFKSSGGKLICACTDGNPSPYYVETMVGYDALGFGKEHNWVGARKIRYKGTDIRVFPDEFSILDGAKMRFFLEDGYELIPEGIAEGKLLSGILDGDQKEIRDAAMVDGADEQMALQVALGADITLPDPEFPPVGWYRCPKEIALLICREYEVEK